jgi:hypothetical protein
MKHPESEDESPMLASQRKGSSWQRAVFRYLQGAGFLCKRRSIGEAGDDITAQRIRRHDLTLSIECKNHAKLNLAGWLAQAEEQCPPGQIPVVWAKRRGKTSAGDGYVIMYGDRFADLLDVVDSQPAPGRAEYWGAD